MVNLDTAHKVAVIVRTAAGSFVPANNQTWTFAPEGIAAKEGAVDVPEAGGTCWYLSGVAAGETQLTIAGSGSSVTIPVTVTTAPLVVEFGTPVAR